MLAGNAFCSLFNKGNFIANLWCFCNVYIYIKHCKISPRVFWSHPLYEECLTKFIQNLSVCCNSWFSFSPAQICTTGAISILVSSSHIAIVWINEWCIYIVLYCVLLYTQSALQSCGGGSLLNPHQCTASTWMMRRLPQDNSASALTTHQLQVERRESHRDNQEYALTTDQLQVERRESHRDNQVYALTTDQLQVERRESHRANQVYALTTHQLQVERRERQRDNQVYALTTHQLQVERRERQRDNQVYALTTHQLQVEKRERHRDNQVYALTTHQLQVERRERHRDNQVYALTTHQLQVETRESHRVNQVDGDYWEAMIDKGHWWKFIYFTPLHFTRSVMGFLMITESQDLGLTSHLKDGAFWQFSVPVTIPGR